MKRLFDIVAAAVLLALLVLPMLCIAVAIKLTSRGPVFHRSTRIGKDNSLFCMPKFRTMHVGTPQVATHLLLDATLRITSLGALLRYTSLDELPQLWSILVGDMSFVGPRPALFNQVDLIESRTDLGIHCLVPGLTGLAQINGRDDLSVRDKVEYDRHYLERCSFWLDLKILAWTAVKVLSGAGIRYAQNPSPESSPVGDSTTAANRTATPSADFELADAA
jgi:O-antigen biosynthesis protein WbqP